MNSMAALPPESNVSKYVKISWNSCLSLNYQKLNFSSSSFVWEVMCILLVIHSFY